MPAHPPFADKLSVKNLIDLYKSGLKEIYSSEEIYSLLTLLFRHFYNWNRYEWSVRAHDKIADADCEWFLKTLGELKRHKPVQYVLGKCNFYGITLNIDERALIPRPETEELVYWVAQEQHALKMLTNKHPKQVILDIGTGSGCIAIALKKYFPLTEVYALDVSKEALDLAEENASINNVDVTFILEDIFQLKGDLFPNHVDIIISNPPYVEESDKERLDKNVSAYEPHLALFVNDTAPLVFYEQILCLACEILKPGGHIYFEINEKHGGGIAALINGREIFENPILRKDIHGKERMISCRRRLQ